MRSEKNSAWLETIEIQSDVVLDALSGKHNLLGADFPWEERICGFLKREPDIAGLYITGPKGCGKHTAAACALDQIRKMAKPGSEYLVIKGTDLMGEGEDLSAAKEKLNFLFDSCYDKRSDLYLLLEEMEDYPDLHGLLDFLGYTLHLYKMNCEDYPRLFLLLISNNEVALPSMLRDKFRCCRMAYPSKRARCTFLEIRGEVLFPRPVSSIDQLVELTEGYSYSDLENLTILLLDERERRPDFHLQPEELSALVAEQRSRDVQTQQFQIFDVLSRLADTLPTFYQALINSVDQLAEKQISMPTVSAQTAPAVQTGDVLQKTSESKGLQSAEEAELERISKEGIGKQVVEIYGDLGRAMLQNLGYDFNNLEV